MEEAHRLLAAAFASQADLVELRLDYFRGPFDLEVLLHGRLSRIIVTNRVGEEGGQWQGSEAERIAPLLEAIRLGAAHVDIEASSLRHLADVPRPRTRLIASFHDFERTPDDLWTIHRRVAASGAEIVKIVCMARSLHDSLRMLDLLAGARLPTIALAMGEYGRMSRVLALRYPNCYLTFASLEGEGGTAPGQVPIGMMQAAFQARAIGRQTLGFGALGFTGGDEAEWGEMTGRLRAAGLDGVYVPLKVAPDEEVAADLRWLRRLDFVGCRVEPPLWERIAGAVERLEPSAQRAGRVDTLYTEGARWTGTWLAEAGDALSEAQVRLWSEKASSG